MDETILLERNAHKQVHMQHRSDLSGESVPHISGWSVRSRLAGNFGSFCSFSAQFADVISDQR